MFGPRRRGFPFPGLFLVVAVFVFAAMVAGAASTAAWLLFLPFLAVKMMFFFFIFGAFLRFAGGGFRPWSPSGRGPWHHGRRPPAPPREPTQDERDWEQARREAQQEIDDLFPDEPR